MPDGTATMELGTSKSKHAITSVIRGFFDQFYIAHIKFDLSDPSFDWRTLRRVWNSTQLGIRRILIPIVVCRAHRICL
jgi:hypothetical protein